jgi:primosomal replication protein N
MSECNGDYNRLVVSGELIEMDALRYTPAGVPILNFTLSHTSRQSEAGIERIVECPVSAVALGEPGLEISVLPLGRKLKFSGFLARKSRRSRRVILHVKHFELIS